MSENQSGKFSDSGLSERQEPQEEERVHSRGAT
jgi:hypothetical protein